MRVCRRFFVLFIDYLFLVLSTNFKVIDSMQMLER